eukprot:TRINITY_DN35907_c0_g1_i1.p1 TRINITY_DN35907_c0_g1~~TRINITY_DN35907_c0_g1_i1.p1  ORF type:complete len:554 (+),score=96.07 TRINITY_DN35907_c0_g1_i1:117-1664(+)
MWALQQLGRRNGQQLLRSLARGVSSSTQPLQDLVTSEEQEQPVAPDPDFIFSTGGGPFRRFATPMPLPYDYTSVLGFIQPTQMTTLSNGLRVVTERVPYAKTATVGVWCNAGSRFEDDYTNGTAHFLEHMFFKGTQKRRVSELEVEIENMGGHLNAYTSREQTVYFMKVMEKDVTKAVDILADILQNSKLDEKAIDHERNVILREMQEIEKMPEEVIFDHLHSTAFQYSPLGRPILGPVDNIKTITKRDLEEYIKKHYTTKRMVIVATGDVDHDSVVKEVEKVFSTLPSEGPSVQTLVKDDPAHFTGSEIRIREPDMPVHFAVAFKGASWTDPDSIPLMVMQTMIGVYDGKRDAAKHLRSKFAQKVAIHNWSENYMCFNTNYLDSGLWGIYAVVKPEHQFDFCEFMMADVTKMAYEPHPYAVETAKTQLKASLLYNQMSTQAVAEEIGRQMLVYGRRMSKAELFARIDSIDADAVRMVADRFFFDQEFVLASLGDSYELPDQISFRRWTYWVTSI